MTDLYPLKFIPILKERIWGGNALAGRWNKKGEIITGIGESWELSAVQNDLSVVSNGFLEGNNIEEIIEVYMGDLVGEEVFEKFGNEFPLLVKLIDAREVLSVQVHPDDKLARERHNAYGKTEMWYVLEASGDSNIYAGFNKDLSREEYIESLSGSDLKSLLNCVTAIPGDSFFIPAGTIHALGGGLVVAEIQQTSDVTYRVFDWNRVDVNGNSRDLHTDLALDALNFSKTPDPRNHITPVPNKPANIADCKYFTVNLVSAEESLTRDYTLTDSFVIYLCIRGSMEIETGSDPVRVDKGETVLIPAITDFVNITSSPGTEFLEIYIKKEQE